MLNLREYREELCVIFFSLLAYNPKLICIQLTDIEAHRNPDLLLNFASHTTLR